MRFDREGDATQALRNSVIAYKGKAFRVTGCYQEGSRTRLTGYFCSSPKREVLIYSDDEEVSHVPPRLGYVNLDGDAVFISREPTRQWKRGHCEHNVHRHLSDQLYHKLVEGKYPSFLVAKKAVKEGLVNRVAFHRNFCYSEEGIMYRDILITDKNENLLSEYSFLSSLLERAKKHG